MLKPDLLNFNLLLLMSLLLFGALVSAHMSLYESIAKGQFAVLSLLVWEFRSGCLLGLTLWSSKSVSCSCDFSALVGFKVGLGPIMNPIGHS